MINRDRAQQVANNAGIILCKVNIHINITYFMLKWIRVF